VRSIYGVFGFGQDSRLFDDLGFFCLYSTTGTLRRLGWRKDILYGVGRLPDMRRLLDHCQR
jgi:hypothetical protein